MQCDKHGQHEIFNQTSNILSHKYKPLEQPIYLRQSQIQPIIGHWLTCMAI